MEGQATAIRQEKGPTASDWEGRQNNTVHNTISYSTGYLKTPEQAKKNLLELISECSKVSGYHNRQKKF
jgi:hypothetical protein